MYSVYILYEGDITRYVGISKRVDARKREHLSGYYAQRTNNKHYSYWFRKLNTPPTFSIAASSLTKEEALLLESELIKNLKRVGCKLVNIAEYGNISENHGKSVSKAWERGSYKTEACYAHYKKMREDRMRDILCTETKTGKTVTVRGLPAAAALTGAAKGNICRILKNEYGYNSAKGWKFQYLQSEA